MVQKFTGDDAYDVNKWFRDLERALEMFRCSENEKLMAAMRKIGGTAATFMRSRDVVSYVDFKQKMLQYFGRTYSLQEVYNQLRERKLMAGESIKHYVAVMLEIAQRAPLPELDIVEAIIDGLQDRSNNISLLFGATTIDQLQTLINRYEKRRGAVPVPIRPAASAIQGGAVPKTYNKQWPTTETPVTQMPGAQPNRQSSSATATDMSQIRCFNCFEYGHYQGGCLKPKRPMNSCFVCGEVGHKKSQCPRRLNRTAAQQPQATAATSTTSVPTAAAGATDAAAANIGLVNECDENWDEPVGHDQLAADQTAEVRRLASQLQFKNLVSVAFQIRNKCIEVKESALFDSGSPACFVKRSLVPFIIDDKLLASNYRGLGNCKVNTHGLIKCHITFRGEKYTHFFFVLPDEDAIVPLLIGRDLMNVMNICLCQIQNNKNIIAKRVSHCYCQIHKNKNKNKLSYSKVDLLNLKKENKAKELKSDIVDALKSFDLFKRPQKNDEKIDSVPTSQGTDCPLFKEKCKSESELFIGAIDFDKKENMKDIEEVILLVDSNGINSDVKVDINPQLPESVACELKSIIKEKYLNKIGNKKMNSFSMKIKLIDNKPVHTNPRRLSYGEKREVQETIDKLLGEGIIQPSESPYASPIVLVRKNGKLRMCVDYRGLNKLTVRDNFPLPLIEDCLEYFSGKKYFTTLDLKSDFHQVPMHPESVPLTSFVTPMGQYEYLSMPFGLTNAPAVFQRIINSVLKKMIDEKKLVVFLDDISIATVTLDQQKAILSEALTLLAEAGLILNFEKCKVGYESLTYLGYRISEKGIGLNEMHIEAIKNFPVPRNTKEVEKCHGLFSYFRKFVRDFARIARPLTNLIKKGAVFEWTDDCMNAFLTLRKKLTEAPILCVYDPKRETELHTGASAKGFGAAIMQKQNDGKFHPVAYFSKCTSAAEANYHSFELETLAIVYALKRFRMFLQGIPFTMVTDCNSLMLTLSKKQINPRIARWALEFEDYNYTVRHRKGDQMAHVDALSRNFPVGEVDGSDVDLNIQISQSRDEIIENLRLKLENADIPGYILENGLVFRVNDQQKKQLYVPKEWEENVMRMVHENYGHMGIEKCATQIQKHYWFPNMREKLNKFIKNCLKCIYYSVPPRSNARNLHSIEKVPEPFHTLHIDHFGPLPSIKSKRKHVLVVVDSFTKFTKLYAVNSTNTKEAICAMKKYFEVYSRPIRIISDQGKGFDLGEFAQFMKDSNIKHVENSVASPQSNGQVKRANRVIKAILAKTTEPIEHSDWVKQLSGVEFAINNTIHCTTKQTPSKMLFGAEQRGEIIDELTEYLHANYSNDTENLNDIRKEAKRAIEKSQLESQKYHKSNHSEAIKFKVGDLVVIKHVDTTIGKNKKFNIKYRGPYCIRKYLGNDRYVITDVENCQLTQMPYENIIDSSRMKLWLEHIKNNDKVDEGNTIEISNNQRSDENYTDYEYLESSQLTNSGQLPDDFYTNYEFLDDDQ